MWIGFSNNDKKINLEVKLCNSIFSKIKGLMFTRKQNAKALLFNFKKPTKIKIHSFFVFFPFLALWLDDNNTIIESKIIKPFKFSISSKKPFSKFVEIPINKKYFSVIKLLSN